MPKLDPGIDAATPLHGLPVHGLPAQAGNDAPGSAALRAIDGAPTHMKEATQRSIVRWIHLVCSIPIIGYIYSPFEHLPDYAPPTRFIFFPIMLLTGLWMWKGHLVRPLFSKKSA